MYDLFDKVIFIHVHVTKPVDHPHPVSGIWAIHVVHANVEHVHFLQQTLMFLNTFLTCTTEGQIILSCCYASYTESLGLGRVWDGALQTKYQVTVQPCCQPSGNAPSTISAPESSTRTSNTTQVSLPLLLYYHHHVFYSTVAKEIFSKFIVIPIGWNNYVWLWKKMATLLNTSHIEQGFLR